MERIWLKQYEPGVPATLSYPSVPVHHFLEESARRFSGNTAVLVAAKQFSAPFTYRRIDALANRFANALIWLGVRPGDRVAIQLPNFPQFVVGFYGALKAGAVVVPVNPLYKLHDLETVLKGSGARVILTLPRFVPNLSQVVAKTALESIVATEVYDLFPFPWKQLVWFRMRKEQRPSGVLKFSALLRSASSRPPRVTVSPDDTAVLQYTGGTTGVPKGAMLSHRNLVANFLQQRNWLPDLKEGGERFLSVAPFFHVYGLTVALNTAIGTGSTVICVVMGLFDARLVAEMVARHRPTIFPGLPAMYVLLNHLKDVRQYDLRSVRVWSSGSAPLPAEVQAEFERLTGASVVEGYGLSEASPGTHANPVYGKHKISSIGLPLPDTDARIVDPETGDQEMPVGEIGELVIHGPQVMQGYWQAPEETAGVLRDGWLRTGDLARMDEEGYFFIVDRKKDVVNVGGLKVFPREIEEVLHEHPKVKEAAVTGVPHPLRGELLIAQVVLKEGVGDEPAAVRRELQEYLRQRLVPYKVPRRIEIVPELPKTATFKVLRREIRETAAARADDEAE